MSICLAEHQKVVVWMLFLYQSHVLDRAQFALTLKVDAITVMFLVIFGLFGHQLDDRSVIVLLPTIVQLFERCVIIECFIFLLVFYINLHFSTN